jgi:hypothetical protein
MKSERETSFSPYLRVSTKTLTVYGFAIAAVWFLARLYFIQKANPEMMWEIWEARKLLEYGFWERRGAILDWHYMTGIVPEPWKYNYVNHPLPIIWLAAFLYSLGGAWLVFAVFSITGLLACLASFLVFTRVTTPFNAMAAAVLLAVAPSAILFDVDTNIIALGSIIWPFTVLVIFMGNIGTRGKAVLAGSVVLLCGLISWFSLAAIPTLILLGYFASDKERTVSRFFVPAGIALGGTLAATWMLIQVLIYTPDWSSMLDYASKQASTEQGVAVSSMAVSFVMRSLLASGPALLLGGALGMFIAIFRPNCNPNDRKIILPFGLFFLVFVVGAIALSRFFYRERSPYEYLLFPLALLTAFSISAVGRGRGFYLVFLAILAAVAAIYPFAQATQPTTHPFTDDLAAHIRAHVPKDTPVVTNLKAQQFPFPPWDASGLHFLRFKSDRHFVFVDGSGQFTRMEPLSDRQGDIYLLEVQGLPLPIPIDKLKEHSIAKVVFSIAPSGIEENNLFVKWREYVRGLIGKNQTNRKTNSPETNGNVSFSLYILQHKDFNSLYN